MKKMNLMIGLLIAAFMLPVGVSAQTVDDQTGKKVKVSGVIIDMETQKTMPRFNLRVKSVENEVRTNDEGKFSFEGYVGDTIRIMDLTYGCLEIPVVTGEEPMTIQIGKLVMPSFPGGMQTCAKFLAENVKYPEEAQKERVQGRVLVNFVVDKDGTLSDIEVIKHVHPALDAEAVRVVKLMPKWMPATVGGKPVRVRYTLPLNFKF